jgi:outer membrane receptor protein involved in Fe transport
MMTNFIVRCLIVSLFSFTACALFAQERSGRVIDDKGNPVDLATVVLFTGDKQNAAAVTDESGYFSVSVDNGEYDLKIRNISYQSFDQIVLVKSETTDLGSFELKESAIDLSEVVVSASTITREPDRFVMQINNVPSMMNKDASEVLRLAPGVWVDDNGVSINGSSGAKVFINERELRLNKKELVDYLRNFRSSDIARVEVIPQAGAEYSADSQSGIVKILLRKQLENGVSGNVMFGTSQGKYVSTYRPSGTINARVGLWTLNASASVEFVDEGKDELTSTRDFYNETDNSFYSRSYMNQRPHSGIGRIGAIYEPDRRNSFGVEFEFFSKKTSVPSLAKRIINENGVTIDETSDYRQDENDRNLSATFNYIYRLDTIGSVLKFITDYTDKKVKGDNDYHSVSSLQDFTKDSVYQSNSRSRYKVFNADISLNKQLQRGMKYSFGAKYTHNDMSDSVLYESLYHSVWQPLKDYSFSLDYKEDIGAVYGTFAGSIGGLSLSAGLRGEYTHVSGREHDMKQSYLDLFPNATISYSFNAMRTFMLIGQYSRNIQRPNFWYLNPNRIQYSDYSYMIGNPNLRPTYVNRFSVTAVYKYRYTLTIGGNLHKDLIREVSKIDPANPDVYYITPENHHAVNHYFVAVNFPLRITKICDMNVNFVGVKEDIRGTEADARKSYLYYFVNVTANLTLPAKFYLELSYNGTSRLYSTNAGIKSRQLFNATIKRQFINDRITASLGINNIFDSKVAYFTNTERFDNNMKGVEGFSSRYVRLGIQYNFNSGKSFKKREIERALNGEKSRLEKSAGKNNP